MISWDYFCIGPDKVANRKSIFSISWKLFLTSMISINIYLFDIILLTKHNNNNNRNNKVKLHYWNGIYRKLKIEKTLRDNSQLSSVNETPILRITYEILSDHMQLATEKLDNNSLDNWPENQISGLNLVMVFGQHRTFAKGEDSWIKTVTTGTVHYGHKWCLSPSEVSLLKTDKCRTESTSESKAKRLQIV